MNSCSSFSFIFIYWSFWPLLSAIQFFRLMILLGLNDMTFFILFYYFSAMLHMTLSINYLHKLFSYLLPNIDTSQISDFLAFVCVCVCARTGAHAPCCMGYRSIIHIKLCSSDKWHSLLNCFRDAQFQLSIV